VPWSSFPTIRGFASRRAIAVAAAILALVATAIGVGLLNLDDAGAPVTTREGSAPVTFMGAGDIAACGSWSGPNAVATGDLIRAAKPDAVWTVGDNAYDDGTLKQYESCYDPAWGSFKDKTYPAPGNHDHHTPHAQGYVDYFGSSKVENAADGGTYYAKDLGNNWRYYALDSDDRMSVGSAQETWLRHDLAAHPGMHYVAAWHSPRYNSGTEHGEDASVCPLWNDLMAAQADIVLVGHEHHYERFGKLDCNGAASDTGIREFMVGVGGNQLYASVDSSYTPAPEFRDTANFGVLELSLYEGSYGWQFVAAGRQWSSSNGGVDSGNKGAILDSGSETTNTSPRSSTPTTSSPASGTVLDRRVEGGSDDAEQSTGSGGEVDLASSDLELVRDGSVTQVVGMRFGNLAIPKGATITSAYLDFVVDETGSTYPTRLTLTAEAADNAPTYAATAGSLSSRAKGAATVAWSITNGWDSVGAVKRTPDIKDLVQEIVSRPGWAPGNALAVQVSGNGHVVVQAYEKAAAMAPLLHVEFQE